MKKAKNFLNLENFFVFIALTFGLLFAVFTPQNEVPDEDSHFVRVYGIVTGNFASQKVTLPASYVKMLSLYHPLATQLGSNETLNINNYLAGFNDIKNDRQRLVEYPLATTYNPILYLPQILGLATGVHLGLNERWAFLLGRIFSVFFYVGLCYFILKTTPVSKRSLFVLFAMPMSIFLAASYSADMVQNSLSFLYLYLIVAGIRSSASFTKKNWWVFLVLIGFLALTKPVSALLPLLTLAIPTARFGSERKKLLFLVSQLAICLVIIVGWTVIISLSNKELTTHPSVSGIVNPTAQLFYVLFNPIATIQMVLRTLHEYNYVFSGAYFYLFSFIGWFGWLTAPMPDFVYFLFLIALSLAILGDMQNQFTLTKRQKIIFLSVFLIYVVGIVMSMYIYWTPPGNEIAKGIQGRYLIPIVPLLLYLAASLRRPEWGRLDRLFTGSVSVIVPVVLAFSFQTIYLNYFVACGEHYYSVTTETCVRPLDLQTDAPQNTVGRLDRPFTQTFVGECNNLSEIAFFLAPYWGNTDGYLDVQLRDLTKDTVVYQTKTFAPKTNGKWKEFSFPPLPDSLNRSFSLTIAPLEDFVNAASLGIMDPDVYPEGELSGASSPGDMVFKYTCRTGFLYDLRKFRRYDDGG